MVLQELCPGCGAELVDASRPCPGCGFDRMAPGARRPGSNGPGIHLGPMGLATLAIGMAAMLALAFRAGMGLGSTPPAADGPGSPPAAGAVAAPLPSTGRVQFAERLGESLELESYRTQFTRDDTIAWRAELGGPPGARELTLVITWISVRERMQLSETSIEVRDPQLTMIGSDEVPLGDLVPTAGLYEVAYYADDVRLAIGVFELLPPAR